jgi:hypothetical protein
MTRNNSRQRTLSLMGNILSPLVAKGHGRTLMLAGTGIALFITVMSIVAPFISPRDPTLIGLGPANSPPSLQFPFGTDQYGRDLLSRTIWGGRFILLVAVTALGRRGDSGTQGVVRQVYHPPKLVERRPQLSNQAGARSRRRDRVVGRLQRRIKIDQEVPFYLPLGPQGQGRHNLGRLRRSRSGSGYRWEGHSSGQGHDVTHHLQIRLKGRWAHRVQGLDRKSVV